MAELVEITSGLKFPEGPIAMPDGTVILVEMFGPRLTRVHPDGRKETIATIPGGPNGAAMGPNGEVYICNNGARFTEMDMGGLTFPGPTTPGKYIGGRIQKVNLATGAVTDLYTECNGNPLRAPNDLVFDAHGGFYFTDHGMTEGRIAHLTGIYYARNDGSSITELVWPVEHPNGIGLSPDGGTLYWAETMAGRIMQRKIASPGVLEEASLVNGGVSVVSPQGELVEFIATGDLLTTNICFGGPDLRTAYITVSGTGKLLSMPWRCPGAKLEFLNT
jgi:gluconolactonase